jgi:hypothetical protein
MSQDLLKTITVSLTSSFCTALFVVACTAGADSKTDLTAPDAPGSDGVDDPGDGGDDPGDGGDDPGDGGDGVDAATLADLELRIADLEDFKSSALCFIGHMTDDQSWHEYDEDSSSSSEWRDIEWDYNSTGSRGWDQGPENSDSKKAWDDCF